MKKTAWVVTCSNIIFLSLIFLQSFFFFVPSKWLNISTRIKIYIEIERKLCPATIGVRASQSDFYVCLFLFFLFFFFSSSLFLFLFLCITFLCEYIWTIQIISMFMQTICVAKYVLIYCKILIIIWFCTDKIYFSCEFYFRLFIFYLFLLMLCFKCWFTWWREWRCIRWDYIKPEFLAALLSIFIFLFLFVNLKTIEIEIFFDQWHFPQVEDNKKKTKK